MDLAYDQIAADALPKDNEPGSENKNAEQQPTLNEDLQEAYKAISSSAWGSRLGGFFGTVVKQGESVYREASQELTSLSADAARAGTSLINRTRSLSLATSPQAAGSSAEKDKDATATPTMSKDMTSDEAIKESENVISRLRAEAAKRLKDIQKAEDAADEALLKFGANIRDFLKEAVKIAPPTTEEGQGSTVLFESKDASGKRVIHTSRYDAQLHVIHTTADSFTKDPAGSEFAVWVKEFDVEKKTDDISADLAKYPELRTTMEKLVPATVPYADFWKRYYFLRHSVEAAEERRKELLKAAEAEEEVGWDEDSDEETAPATKPLRPASTESSTTIHPPKAAEKATLKPSEPRKSHDEKSQADSDTSYDVVGAASGVPSQAPSSPKESRKVDDSDEEDWE
ncbi:BSD domain-containing protein [Seiridium cupressi]